MIQAIRSGDLRAPGRAGVLAALNNQRRGDEEDDHQSYEERPHIPFSSQSDVVHTLGCSIAVIGCGTEGESKKGPRVFRSPLEKLERATGFEPATSSLGRRWWALPLSPALYFPAS